jgi:hypothetical protein
VCVLGITAPHAPDCGAARAIAEARRPTVGKRVTLAGDSAAAAGTS